MMSKTTREELSQVSTRIQKHMAPVPIPSFLQKYDETFCIYPFSHHLSSTWCIWKWLGKN